MTTLTFDPPGWGTWEQDRAHNPKPVSRLLFELVGEHFSRGFLEGFELYGVPIHSVTPTTVNGYTYLRLHFVGEPGPDGPADPAEMGAFVGRCAAAAEAALEQKVWRDVMRRWETEIKPAAIEAHLALARVDLSALSDADLAAHLLRCMDHQRAMGYQHHRFNTSAIFPVADCVLQTAGWIGRPPFSLLGLFEGSSPISGVWSSEIEPAAKAIALDAEAASLLDGDGDPGERLARLRARLPEVDDWMHLVGPRLVDGFDVTGPTLGELPGLALGKLAAAVALGGPPEGAAGAELEREVRELVPAEHRAAFDELLADARLVYRLRDERGVYSDMTSTGLLRLAILEVGRRAIARGVVDDAELLLDAGVDELVALSDGATSPDGVELRARAEARHAAALVDAPAILGAPHAPPPPPEMLPPALGRVAAGVGFGISTILHEIDEPSMVDGVIRGLPGNGGVFEGKARLIKEIADLTTLEPGDILVSPTTSEAFNCAIHLLGAIVTDHGGVASHAAIVSREVGIPAVVGTGNASTIITDGARIRVDGTAGEVTLLS